MSVDPVDAISRAVLYEGYALYPYRPSALKNRRRWMLGGLYPRAWAEGQGERWCSRTECLLAGGEATARVRFLHGEEEREVVGAGPFGFPGIRGEVAFEAAVVADGVTRVTVVVRNLTDLAAAASRDEAGACCLWSAQVLLRARGGRFVSLADPPDSLREAAAACRNEGTWPALVAPDAVLSAPVILQDYPSVAPESPGDLFDATEIDEILSLRILTLTEEEKRQAREADGRVRALLDRVEALGVEGLGALHGAIRRPKPGDKVRLRPRDRADIMDLALAGKVATVVAVEVDFDDRTHVAVTVDDDPGQDLGQAGLPGHRFYFGVHEVEPL